MQKEMTEFEKELNLEIDKRISQIEQEEYDLGKSFSKTNWVFVGIAVVFGLGLILMGI